MPPAMLSRRTLLRGLLGGAAVSIALPPLEAFFNTSGTAYAGGGGLPTRFGIFYWGNGVLPDRWVPTGNGPDWQPSLLLAPLAPVKQYVTVVSGTRVQTANTSPHISGPAGLFTGDSLDGDSFKHASIDQVIAQSIGNDTRFRSLEVGVQRSTSSFSYSAPHQVNPPETSPAALFARLFGPDFRAPGDMSAPDPRNRLRQSVLDAVQGQSTRLRLRLGATDRRRLDQHLDGIRSLETRIQRLASAPPAAAACVRPHAPMDTYPDLEGRPQMSAISRAIADIVAMALACDQTRVFTNMFSQPVNNTLYPGASAGHHQLTHDEPGDQPQVQAILLSIMTELGYLLNALRAIPEGEGTVLDHSVVLATTDCSFGRTHAIDNYPILLCGSAGGALRQGVHYHSTSGENASAVMLTLLRAMGVHAADYGVGAGHVTDGLGALTP